VVLEEPEPRLIVLAVGNMYELSSEHTNGFIVPSPRTHIAPMQRLAPLYHPKRSSFYAGGVVLFVTVIDGSAELAESM
jgi:hypothetical protein